MPDYKKYQSYAWIAIIGGLAVVVHHLMICGRLFDWGDILHHEFITITLFALALGILLVLPKPYRKPPQP